METTARSATSPQRRGPPSPAATSASCPPNWKTSDGFFQVNIVVNPGNSGGPLCSKYGAIVGMVARKSNNTGKNDSFGFVIPGERLKTFVLKNLPKGVKFKAKRPPEDPMEWDEVTKRMEPSVVCVLNYQSAEKLTHAEEHQEEATPSP